MTSDLERLIGVGRSGVVTEVNGTVLRATLPDVRLGEICAIHTLQESGSEPLLGGASRPRGTIEAEVVGFDRRDAVLMPLGTLEAVASGARVEPIGAEAAVPCGDALRGRVIDALGVPLDGKGPIRNPDRIALMNAPPNPMLRKRVTEVMPTGVRAIDALLTLGVGQRVGLFAAAGGGKSTLLAMIARTIAADRVVVALIGERGREVRGFIEDALGTDGLAKSTVVVSTSDQPALLRLRAAYTATAIAEAGRARGERVVLLMDSVTRFARALRDVGLAAGEPPGRQGFPGSVFARLPVLFERAGNDSVGSITAIYTVLVAGDDLEEPIADETISLLDGHILLKRELAEQGQYPAIDILGSKSRLMNELTTPEHRAAALTMKRALSVYRANYDKIQMGRFDPPTKLEADLAAKGARVPAFLGQGEHEPAAFADSVKKLEAWVRS